MCLRPLHPNFYFYSPVPIPILTLILFSFWFFLLFSGRNTNRKLNSKMKKKWNRVVLASQTIITMLPSSPQMKEVYTGERGVLSVLNNDKLLSPEQVKSTLCIDSTTLDVDVGMLSISPCFCFVIRVSVYSFTHYNLLRPLLSLTTKLTRPDRL